MSDARAADEGRPAGIAHSRVHPVPDVPRAPRSRLAALTDAELLAAMRDEDPRAVAELYRRFAPLLRRRAAQWHVAGTSCEELVDDVLSDAALALMRPGATTPRSVAAYLLVALRHRLANARRAAERRERDEREASSPELPHARATRIAATARVSEPVLAIVHASVSAHARRAAAGSFESSAGGDAHAPLHPVLARLAAHLDAGLREPDRLLLTWLADHVPMRTVAAWLGIGYDAALKRSSRLRARLRAEALSYTDTLPDGERRVVHAFLGRAAGDDAGAQPPAETGS